MVKMPILTAEAVRALARATLGGPNCRHKDGFEQFLNAEKDTPLDELSPFFHHGPDTFLLSYAVRHRIYKLGPKDIVRAYCLDHISMVRAAEKTFQQNGYGDDYFQDMREEGFRLNTEGKLYQYLFSCIGQVGKVVQVTRGQNGSKRLRVFFECGDGDRCIEITHVCTSQNVARDEYVVMHFASVFTKVSSIVALNIIQQQQSDEWFRSLIEEVRELKYTDWLGQDLSAWTEERLARN